MEFFFSENTQRSWKLLVKKKQSAFIADEMSGGTSGNFWEVIWVISRKKIRENPLNWFWIGFGRKKAIWEHHPSRFVRGFPILNTLLVGCRTFTSPPPSPSVTYLMDDAYYKKKLKIIKRWIEQNFEWNFSRISVKIDFNIVSGEVHTSIVTLKRIHISINS